MSHPLTQHRVSSPLKLAQYIKSGNQTVLESVEFDIFVNDRGELVVGHPGEVRRGVTRMYSVQEFFELLKRLETKQLVVDIKARSWNEGKKEAEFGNGEIDALLEHLPKIIEDYIDNKGDQASVPEVVIASVDLDLFREIQKRGVQLPDEIKLRAFTRDKVADQFRQAVELGVDQIGIEFPKDADPSARLDELLRQSTVGQAADLKVSFYTVDDPQTIRDIHQRFPTAEIITNISSELEGREDLAELKRKRR